MIAPSSPRIAEVKRCSSESQHLNAVKVRKKSMTIERLEDRQFRTRNSVCHVSQRDPKLDYQLSSDMLALQETSFAKKYGDPVVVIKAAITIQRCWRKHYLNKTFHRIKLETPYRTKSMNSKVKPIVKIRHISSSTENLADEVVRVSTWLNSAFVMIISQLTYTHKYDHTLHCHCEERVGSATIFLCAVF